jgi:hypothetical protein
MLQGHRTSYPCCRAVLHCQHKHIIYNMCKFLNDIYEHPEYFNKIVHKAQEKTAEICGIRVYCSSVQNICNRAIRSSTDNQVLASAWRAYERKQFVRREGLS